MIKTTHFHYGIRTGSSLPVVVNGGDGNTYVVKPHGNAEGALAGAVEWLALKLGRLLEIPTPTLKFLTIGHNTIFWNDSVQCLDCASSIALRDVISGENSQSDALLSRLKLHPFHSAEIDPEIFIKKTVALADDWVHNLIEEIPNEWIQ